MLTLARAPPKDEKEKQQRLMRIQRVVSHAIWPSPPEASRSTSNPFPDPPLSLLLLLKCILCLVFVILFKLFIAWQCSAVQWLVGGALCLKGCPGLLRSYGVMVVDCAQGV